MQCCVYWSSLSTLTSSIVVECRVPRARCGHDAVTFGPFVVKRGPRQLSLANGDGWPFSPLRVYQQASQSGAAATLATDYSCLQARGDQAPAQKALRSTGHGPPTRRRINFLERGKLAVHVHAPIRAALEKENSAYIYASENFLLLFPSLLPPFLSNAFSRQCSPSFAVRPDRAFCLVSNCLRSWMKVAIMQR